MSKQLIAIRKAYLMLLKYRDDIIDAEPDPALREEMHALIAEMEELIS